MNFDFIASGSEANCVYIWHLRHLRVWEYSVYNVVNLATEHGVEACLSPLGYVPELVYPDADTDPAAVAAGEPIDALFFGPCLVV